MLRDGTEVPSVGLGFWKIPKPMTGDVLFDAVSIGYRHLDCACDYGNESEAGDGLRRVWNETDVRRDDLWVTSKLWNTYHRPEHVASACQRSLDDLGLDHLDLYMIHFPISQRFVPFDERYPPEWFFDPHAESPQMELDPVPIVETWQAMVELRDRGLVRHVGVCNFGTSLLRDLLASTETPPEMLQIELHPKLCQNRLLRYCREQQIAVTAFSPLGATSYVSIGMAAESDSLLNDPQVQSVASDIGRTPAQGLLRGGLQRGTAVITKSQSPDHLRDNLALFDFELDAAQMESLTSLDQHRRYNDPGDFCETAFHTFCPIFD